MKEILIIFVILCLVWQVITFGSSSSYLEGAIIMTVQSVLLKSYIEKY
jgi:hypothetical protein